MPNIIDSIQISSSTFDVRDKSATTVVNLTQEQYDNLPSSAKTANVLYNITDATAGDLSQYWTSAQTQSAITEATSGKADTSYVDQSVSGKVDITTFNTYSGNVETSLSGKQDTLSAGTGIDITDNVISATGGGGKAVSGGTNISITTGETADTINCTLPITATSSAFNTISVGQGSGGGSYNTLIGPNARCDNNNGHNVFLVAQNSSNSSQGAYVNGTHNVIIGAIKNGYLNFSMPSFTASRSVVVGGGGISTDKDNSVAIGYQANVSGTTKTNINNQLTIDTSNQVYIYNKDNTEMICLQDALGGGGSSYSAGTGIDITNDVISVTGMTAESAFTAHTADTTIHVTSSDKTTWSGKQDALVSGTNIKTINNESILGSGNITIQGGGGSSVVELTQAQYDALTTIDPDTIYVITDAAGGDLSNYYTKAQINAMIGDIESLLAAI